MYVSLAFNQHLSYATQFRSDTPLNQTIGAHEASCNTHNTLKSRCKTQVNKVSVRLQVNDATLRVPLISVMLHSFSRKGLPIEGKPHGEGPSPKSQFKDYQPLKRQPGTPM
jgi:hypothetical protein